LQPVRRVPCQRCGTPAPFGKDNKWRPFCSERCRNIDLGDWASERYRVKTDEGPRPAEDKKEPEQEE